MRIIEITDNLLLSLTNEESSLLDKLERAKNGILKKDLKEREQYIANKLVEKDVFLRRNEDGKIKYYTKIRV